jgi:hypothetical protein
MDRHPGIVISRIPASGGGGLIFALGMALVCLLAAPALWPVVAGCAAAGFALSLVLGRLTAPQATSLASAISGTAMIASFVSALASPGLRDLALLCVLGGIAAALALARFQPAPLSIRDRSGR